VVVCYELLKKHASPLLKLRGGIGTWLAANNLLFADCGANWHSAMRLAAIAAKTSVKTSCLKKILGNEAVERRKRRTNGLQDLQSEEKKIFGKKVFETCGRERTNLSTIIGKKPDSCRTPPRKQRRAGKGSLGNRGLQVAKTLGNFWALAGLESSYHVGEVCVRRQPSYQEKKPLPRYSFRASAELIEQRASGAFASG